MNAAINSNDTVGPALEAWFRIFQMADIEIPLFSVRIESSPGLASVALNLVRGLAALGKRISLSYTTKARLPVGFYEKLAAEKLVRFHRFPGIPGGVPVRFVEETLHANCPPGSRHILYPNYFLPPQLFFRKARKSVIIHDCQHRVFPDHFSPRKQRWLDFNFRRTLLHADHIFFISEFEKNQIARFFGEDLAQRGSVIYNPVDWSRYEGKPASDAILELASQPYILCVAHAYPHKNTKKTIEAFVKLLDRGTEMNFVLVGRVSEEVQLYLKDAMPAHYKGHVKLPGIISDADLGYLYSHARLFVLASSYEGFGLPAAEAMGLGAPVLVAEGTALPEVTLGAAQYCRDDAPADEWAEAMAACIDQPLSPEKIIDLKSKVRARYGPEVVAARVLKEMGNS